jgi:hypothetical protein
MWRNLYTIFDFRQALLCVQKDGTSVEEPRQNQKGKGQEAKRRPTNHFGLYKDGAAGIQQMD